MEEASIICGQHNSAFGFIQLTEYNYDNVCDFAKGQSIRKVDNPTIPKGKYFGISLYNCFGKNIAYIGDYIVRLSEDKYMVFPQEAFHILFAKD